MPFQFRDWSRVSGLGCREWFKVLGFWVWGSRFGSWSLGFWF